MKGGNPMLDYRLVNGFPWKSFEKTTDHCFQYPGYNQECQNACEKRTDTYPEAW